MSQRLTAINQCPRCGDDITIENFLGAWPWPDNVPLVKVAIGCPCGLEGTMNLPLPRFERLQLERVDLEAEMISQAREMTQRARSEMGREVAAFRSQLEEISTLEDIPVW